MTANREPAAAWRYHDSTKHSARSVRENAHFLDWQNMPLPFKIYPTVAPIPLPRQFKQTGMAALSVIAQAPAPPRGPAVPDLDALAMLLYFSAGITKERDYPGGKFYFRAAACTGALYEFELYLVAGELLGLAAGVYHFSPADFALRPLRSGDWRGVLSAATADEPSVAHAPVTIVCTGTYWRNAWKYQARTYRHFGWDNGTLLANLLAMSTGLQLPAEVVCGFVDDDVNRLLDLDAAREVVFTLVPVGCVPDPPPRPPGDFVPLGLETMPLSRKQVDYPAMREMHAASSLASVEEVRHWRGGFAKPPIPAAAGVMPLAPLSDQEIPRDSIEQVILRRGSTRQFARVPITFAQLATMLHRSTRGVPADFLDPGQQLNDIYLIVNAVEGLNPGAYFFHREANGLQHLREGDFRREASYLGLEQELTGDAAVAMFFLADLPRILDRFGNRGYRVTQLEAGVIGGKLYLAAYALRLGATGLTFFDDDVVNFFSPHAQGKSAIFLVAVGKSVKQQS
jgi:SagB-type dehydrogenase family enzyme